MEALIVPGGDGSKCAELVRETDRLMYSAKACGKNEVRIETATRPPLAWRQAAPAAVSQARQAV